ncbi:MAG: hypothetical protein HY954_09240 [Deltaproteobacteria bacterium]|nr:hypothetical protein [Deltaproteobacteria bacterium]
MENKIKELFAAILKMNAEAISDSATPRNISGWDSLQHMFLVSGFEEEFGIEIEPEEAVEMYRDYSAFKSVVAKKLGQALWPAGKR